MEASFLPKVQGQGGKQKEYGHSLLFDNAMADKVLRLNAYEDRLLLKRTEHIERQKQQSLEEHNFWKSQFLLRFSPVVKRQNELKRQFLSKVFDPEAITDRKLAIGERNRPLSSYPNVKSRTSTATLDGKTKPIVRRSMSAELRFPALQESMDDILNGYRTHKPKLKSVSPTKMRCRGNWNMESPRHGGESQNETFLPRTITPEKRTRFKEIHLSIVKAEENAEQLTDAFSSSCPKLSKGEAGKIFSPVSVWKSPDEHSTNVVAKDDDKSSEQEATITLRGTMQPIPVKNQRRKPTKPAKNSNEDSSGVSNNGNSTLFPKQPKMFPNDNKLPEELLKNLIHSLNSDETASNTSRFLARMLSNDEYDNLDKPSSLVPFQFENAAEVHLLSDVKKRQRYETQRLRIMRTFVLAYDSVWNERAKKISTAA